MLVPSFLVTVSTSVTGTLGLSTCGPFHFHGNLQYAELVSILSCSQSKMIRNRVAQQPDYRHQSLPDVFSLLYVSPNF